MQLTEVITALSSNSPELIRGMLRIFHFLGLALGLGAAMLLDLMIMRLLMGRAISKQTYDFFRFCADFVSVGLLMLWITGAGFLLYYWAYDPIKLGNEKVWAKMVIVMILTLNGAYIHKTIIPFMAGQIGGTMMQGLSRARQHLFVSAGIISFVSWYGPLVIANLPHLNFQVPMTQILTVYVIVLVSVFILAHIGLVSAGLIEQETNQKPRRGGKRNTLEALVLPAHDH